MDFQPLVNIAAILILIWGIVAIVKWAKRP